MLGSGRGYFHPGPSGPIALCAAGARVDGHFSMGFSTYLKRGWTLRHLTARYMGPETIETPLGIDIERIFLSLPRTRLSCRRGPAIGTHGQLVPQTIPTDRFSG